MREQVTHVWCPVARRYVAPVAAPAPEPKKPAAKKPKKVAK